MNQTHFEVMTRSLTRIPSRRDVLRGLAGAALGGLLTVGGRAAEASNGGNGKNKKGKKVTLCHKEQTIRASKSALKRHRKHGDTVGACPLAPAPPSPTLTYQCPGPKNNTIFKGNSARVAQTFTASQSGSLLQIQFSVSKYETTGDYLVQLLRVIGGAPSHEPADVLAEVTVPDAAVPLSSDATLTATFAGPALVAGTEYAASFSRPGSTNTAPNTRKGDGSACGGRFFEADGAGAFTEAATHDTLVSVLVT